MIYYIIIGFVLGVGVFFIFPFFSKKRKLLRIVEKHKYLYIFVYFLVKNKAYKAYTSNLNNTTIETMYLTYNSIYLISEAFIWDDTKQGLEYWEDLNKLWVKSLPNLTNNLSKESVIKILKL